MQPERFHFIFSAWLVYFFALRASYQNHGTWFLCPNYRLLFPLFNAAMLWMWLLIKSDLFVKCFIIIDQLSFAVATSPPFFQSQQKQQTNNWRTNNFSKINLRIDVCNSKNALLIRPPLKLLMKSRSLSAHQFFCTLPYLHGPTSRVLTCLSSKWDYNCERTLNCIAAHYRSFVAAFHSYLGVRYQSLPSSSLIMSRIIRIAALLTIHTQFKSNYSPTFACSIVVYSTIFRGSKTASMCTLERNC